MTSDQPPPEPPTPELGPARAGDETVSAVLDGEASDGQRGRVEGDPALSARLEQFRAVSRAVAEPPPTLAGDQGDALVASALAAAEPSALAPPTALATRRAARARRLPPMGLVAAAVVVLMVAAAALILTGRSDHRTTSAAREKLGVGGATDESARKAASGHSAGAPAPNASATAPDPVPPAAPFVGAFANQDDLRAALKALEARTLQPARPLTSELDGSTAGTSSPATGATSGSGTTSAAVTAAQFRRCDGVVRANDPDLGAPLIFAPAQVAPRMVLVISYALSADPARVRQYAVDAVSCVPLLAVDR